MSSDADFQAYNQIVPEYPFIAKIHGTVDHYANLKVTIDQIKNIDKNLQEIITKILFEDALIIFIGWSARSEAILSYLETAIDFNRNKVLVIYHNSIPENFKIKFPNAYFLKSTSIDFFT